MTVAYQALHGDEAGYAGIAALYQDYLLEQGMTATTEESAPYAVTLLGGTNITTSIFGIPRKKLVTMTTFSQAQSIVSELQETTGTLPLVRLMGYGYNAGYPAGCPSVNSGHVLASHVLSCQFVHDPNQGATQQNGFVWLQLVLARSGERTTLAFGAHVDNAP